MILAGANHTKQIICLDKKGYKADLKLNYLSEYINKNCLKLIDEQIKFVYENRKPFKLILSSMFSLIQIILT